MTPPCLYHLTRFETCSACRGSEIGHPPANPTFYFSLRQEEGSGGRGKSILHSNPRCASAIGDWGSTTSPFDAPFCRKCVKS